MEVMHLGPHFPLNVRMGGSQEPLWRNERRLLDRPEHSMFTIRQPVNKVSNVS
jgi:hypothetical protein